MTHVLIVEDEHLIARLIEMSLTRAGYDCTVAGDGRTAADLIEENDYDLALLDIMLPGLDGYELLEYLRPQGVPVIFITAKGTVKERVEGLRRGADDYIVKPFVVEELLARVESVLRRAGRGNVMQAFDVVLDAGEHTVTQNGQAVDLTPNEFCCWNSLCATGARPSTGKPSMSGSGAATWPIPIPVPWTCTSCACGANCIGTTISRPFTALATA